jgi:hypothetical protein
MNELIPVAYLRLSQLLLSMVETAKRRDKQHLLELIRAFEEDYDAFVDLVAEDINLADEDIQGIISPEQEADLLTQAASAQAGFRLPIVLAETSIAPSAPIQSAPPPLE